MVLPSYWRLVILESNRNAIAPSLLDGNQVDSEACRVNEFAVVQNKATEYLIVAGDGKHVARPATVRPLDVTVGHHDRDRWHLGRELGEEPAVAR
jgi:hypothetical protein